MKASGWKKWSLRVTQGVLCAAMAASLLVGADGQALAKERRHREQTEFAPVTMQAAQLPKATEATPSTDELALLKGQAPDLSLPLTGQHLLSRGSSGSAVWALQYRLKLLGYYTYYKVTGYYGSITQQAVRKFQYAYGIKVDGIAGPVTQRQVIHAIIKRRLVADSKKYLGKPYVWGSSNPNVGFDCSGFVYYMFRKEGYAIPRYTSTQLYGKGRWISRSKLRPGDLVFFALEGSRISHVGFYMGYNQFISATSSKGIAIYSLNNSYWGPHYRGARRVY
ncbi:MAG TPA: NlpC/P60 family protein [Bacilli bacterium]|nr:NlpC/P60 family protein [Bacilli bacterium]